MIFEDKCFKCPLKSVIENEMSEHMKEWSSRNMGVSYMLSCGGVFQPCNKSPEFMKRHPCTVTPDWVEFFKGSDKCALDRWIEYNKISLK